MIARLCGTEHRVHESTYSPRSAMLSGKAPAGGDVANRLDGSFVLVAALLAGTALAAAATPPPPPNMHPVLQIKPGLWEFDGTTKVVGDAVFPDAALTGVPVTRRVQRLMELRQMIARPSRERECMSQAIFEQRLFGIEPSCHRAVASNTGGRLEILTECHGESGGLKQSTNARILATTATSVTTSFHAVSTRADKTMTVDSIESGRWIGSSCGNVHGIEILN